MFEDDDKKSSPKNPSKITNRKIMVLQRKFQADPSLSIHFLRKNVTHFWGVFRECNLLGAIPPTDNKELFVI